MAARLDRSLVLLVDDEPDQIEMYQLGLELAGFSVIAAYTGGDGLVLARTRQPAAIVLDIRLPDMTGWDVCVALRDDPATSDIPVVILTAAATPTIPAEAAASGCAAYLLKPCFPEELARTVREVIASHLQA